MAFECNRSNIDVSTFVYVLKIGWGYNHGYYSGIIYTQYKMMKLWRMSDFTNCMKGKNSWDPTS